MMTVVFVFTMGQDVMDFALFPHHQNPIREVASCSSFMDEDTENQRS